MRKATLFLVMLLVAVLGTFSVFADTSPPTPFEPVSEFGQSVDLTIDYAKLDTLAKLNMFAALEATAVADNRRLDSRLNSSILNAWRLQIDTTSYVFTN